MSRCLPHRQDGRSGGSPPCGLCSFRVPLPLDHPFLLLLRGSVLTAPVILQEARRRRCLRRGVLRDTLATRPAAVHLGSPTATAPPRPLLGGGLAGKGPTERPAGLRENQDRVEGSLGSHGSLLSRRRVKDSPVAQPLSLSSRSE